MKNAPNDIVALEWLAPQWLNQLTTMYDAWCTTQGQKESVLEELVQQFESLASELSVISLSELSCLAQDASHLASALADGDIMPSSTSVLGEAIQLLIYLLKRRGMADRNQSQLIELKRGRIASVLGESVTLTEKQNLSSQLALLLPPLNNINTSTSAEALIAQWHSLNDTNQPLSPQELSDIATALAESDLQERAKVLWRMTALWLSKNIEDTPVNRLVWQHLGESDLYEESDEQPLLLENALVDVYVAFASQQTLSEVQQQHLVTLGAGAVLDESFFVAVLRTLEMVLFKFDSGDSLDVATLEHLRERFAYRGWAFFDSYIAQILKDAQESQEAWQLSTQLQDLYAGIQRIANLIDERIVKKDADTHQEGVLFLLGDIEAQFEEYLRTADVLELPSTAQLDELAELFEEVGADSTVIARLVAFFTKLRSLAPTRFSKSFANLTTQSVARIDAFVDGLAVGVNDENLLAQALDSLEEADAMMTLEVAEEELLTFVPPSKDVLRYDDEGVIEPEDAFDESKKITQDEYHDDVESEQIEQDKSETDDKVVISAAYQEIVKELKPDDFGYDEDIREIFIEEAEEVLAELDTLLPVWQTRPQDLKPLKDIRRGFHTLKGSGRMVGAFSVGEMSWALENMLNRVLDGSIKSNGAVAGFVAEVASLLPTLVQDFKDHNPPSYDVAVIALKANNILKGKDIDEGVPTGSIKQTTSVADIGQLAVEDGHTEELSAIAQQDVEMYAKEDEQKIDQRLHEHEEMLVLPEVLSPFMEKASQPLVSTITEVDPDIKEIFIDEAEEVLTELPALFVAWQRNRQDMAILADIRRGFHTLKGSGRMVGANEIAELSWALENMLNRVLDETIVMDAGMAALVSDVLTSMPKLVALFKDEISQYPEERVLWMACAQAYSEGHADEFDYRVFSQFAHSHGAQWLDADLPKDWQGQKQDYMRPSVEALDVIHEAGEIISNATLTAPANEEEEQLCAIFIEEARELLLVVKQFLSVHKSLQAVAVSDDIVRAFHTLRGASGLPPLVVIGEVSALIEKSLQGLQQHEDMMTTTHLSALNSSVQLIESHLDSYEAKLAGNELAILNQELVEEKHLLEHMLAEDQAISQDKPFDISELIDGIDMLLDADTVLAVPTKLQPEEIEVFALEILKDIETLKERTQNSSKFQRLLTAMAGGYRVLQSQPQWLYEPDFVDCLVACHEDLTELFDAIAGSMSLRLSRSPELLDTIVADIATGKFVSQATLLARETPTEPPVYESITTDPDLLDIFLAEVQSIDGVMAEAFDKWQANPSDFEVIKGLQRHTQTIKGGARLAEVDSIYALMDKADGIYAQLITNTLSPTADWVRVLRGVQDILVLQIDELKTSQRSFYAPSSMTQLQQFLDEGMPEGSYLKLPLFEQEESSAAPVEEVAQGELTTPTDFVSYQKQSWQGNAPDTDILAVFLEEADELVESGMEDFQAFRANTSDVAALQSLQRNLHTIKGGARMVGANGIADLAHEMETVYEDLGARRQPVTRNVTALLLACQDWIADAIRLLKYQVNPPVPTALIDALARFSKNPDSLDGVPTISLENELALALAHEMYEKERTGGRDITRMPPMKGAFAKAEEAVSTSEMIRIPSTLIERMINLTGEASINRARIDMSMAGLGASIEEMGITIQRLADQLRRMDVELEAQILAQIDEQSLLDENFDPLEMDQYSALNQLSKSLAESASDLLDLKSTLLEKTRDGENLLLQLSRTHAEIQDGLMNSRMLPFSRLTPRFQRLVRQVASELDKQVNLTVVNADDEMDKTILERITSPLEHMLRNAIDHGIETTEQREIMGKPRAGQIRLEVVREGNEVLIHLSDDGAGINVEAVRKKAIAQGLISANDDTLTDLDVMQYIFNAGFTTTNAVTQISGRGVGMDVVRSEIRQLGGTVSVTSVRGQGSRFTMRVPLTVAMSDALIVRVADRHYAIPLVQIERISQANPKALIEYYQSAKGAFEMDGVDYRLRYLNELLSGHNFAELLSAKGNVPVIVVKNQTGQNLALQVDEIIGSRLEVVVKPLGRQLSHIAGISAATIMADGSVMFILDLMALIRNAQARVAAVIEMPKATEKRPLVMVVDDSVTVRKVTSRFLERQGYDTVVAKDGVDAIEMLQELVPDIMLLDIEMPRMDGFEVATQIRHNARLKHLPIIMITSRTGEKHRERAFEVGVSDYMGKPFQENELLARIDTLLAKG